VAKGFAYYELRAGGGRATVLPQDELAKLRFGMSEMPQPGGQKGDYEEKQTQWFLERSFFRDFTYRNPRGKKKSEELADAVVLFDDVAFLVQVKAQYGNHEAMAWATEATLKALKQVRATHDNLKSGAIRKFENDVYGAVDFEPTKYPNMYGIIIWRSSRQNRLMLTNSCPRSRMQAFLYSSFP
jgi:hypothetical protein